MHMMCSCMRRLQLARMATHAAQGNGIRHMAGTQRTSPDSPMQGAHISNVACMYAPSSVTFSSSSSSFVSVRLPSWTTQRSFWRSSVNLLGAKPGGVEMARPLLGGASCEQKVCVAAQAPFRLALPGAPAPAHLTPPACCPDAGDITRQPAHATQSNCVPHLPTRASHPWQATQPARPCAPHPRNAFMSSLHRLTGTRRAGTVRICVKALRSSGSGLPEVDVACSCCCC